MARTTINLPTASLSRDAPRVRVYKILTDPIDEVTEYKREVGPAKVLTVQIHSGAQPSVAQIEYQLGPQKTTAKTKGASASSETDYVYATDWRDPDKVKLQIEDRVRIEVEYDGTTPADSWAEEGYCVFEGYITNVSPLLDAEEERLIFVAQSYAWRARDTQVQGRYAPATSDADETSHIDVPCVFNATGPDGAMQTTFDATYYAANYATPESLLNDTPVSRFTYHDSGRRVWYVRDIVLYIVNRYLDTDLWDTAQIASELDKHGVLALVYTADLNVEGMTPLEAIELVLARVGYGYTEIVHPFGYVGKNHWLRFWRRGGVRIGTDDEGQPIFESQKEVRLPAVRAKVGDSWENVNARKAELQRLEQSVDASEYVTRVVGIGAPVLYEADFELTADWSAALQGADGADYRMWDDKAAGTMNPEFETNKNVYRRWKLGEDDADLAHAKLASVILSSNEAVRPRLFQNRFDKTDEGGAIQVYTAASGGTWGDAKKISFHPRTDKAGIYITENEIDGITKAESSATPYSLKVRAVIESDERLTVTVDNTDEDVADAQGRYTVTKYVYDDRFEKWLSIASGGATQTTERDDTTAFEEYLTRKLNALCGYGTATGISIFEFTTKFQPGDVITKIAGRDRYLGKGLGRYPTVAGVRWHFGADLTTELLLDDERLALA